MPYLCADNHGGNVGCLHAYGVQYLADVVVPLSPVVAHRRCKLKSARDETLGHKLRKPLSANNVSDVSRYRNRDNQRYA